MLPLISFIKNGLKPTKIQSNSSINIYRNSYKSPSIQDFTVALIPSFSSNSYIPRRKALKRFSFTTFFIRRKRVKRFTAIKNYIYKTKSASSASASSSSNFFYYLKSLIKAITTKVPS
jgi:hypothetical protein